jgi:hypothetical protein
MGPCVVFDKSTLQALSMDESVWFDSFLMGNITPLFYVETLADLEKSVRAGKTPEQVVGMLADKTPLEAVPNVYHRTIYLSELAGNGPIGMDGRPILGGGTPKRTPDGKTSIHFDQFPEAAALNRWRNGEFMDIERLVAKDWRQQLANLDQDSQILKLKNIFPTGTRISNLEQLKVRIDEFCNGNYKQLIELMMDILEVLAPGRSKIIAQWEAAGKKPLSEFAPYSTHVFKVELLYYLGIDRGFISGVRASNKADLAYLFYLPFCNAFVSGDGLHARTVPLFLREDQTYVTTDELKVALQEFDKYFDGMPDEVKELGVMNFAGYPPAHMDNIVIKIWDKNTRPDWRKISKEEEQKRMKPRDSKLDKEFITKMTADMDASTDLEGDAAKVTIDEVDQVFIKRMMPVHRGKWRMVSKEIEDAEDKKDSTK